MSSERVKMQESNLAILVKNKGFQFTDTFFPYTSGEIGPYYVQSAVVQNNGADYKHSISSLADLVHKYTPSSQPIIEVISGGGVKRLDILKSCCN